MPGRDAAGHGPFHRDVRDEAGRGPHGGEAMTRVTRTGGLVLLAAAGACLWALHAAPEERLLAGAAYAVEAITDATVAVSAPGSPDRVGETCRLPGARVGFDVVGLDAHGYLVRVDGRGPPGQAWFCHEGTLAYLPGPDARRAFPRSWTMVAPDAVVMRRDEARRLDDLERSARRTAGVGDPS